MRRISLIVISVLIVVGLGTGTYAYVAYDRGLWPFEGKQISTLALTGSFADVLSDQTAMYALLDLANSDVNKVVINNPKLKTNIDLIKQGWRRLTAEMQNNITKDNPDVGMFLNNILTHKLHFAFADNSNSSNYLLQNATDEAQNLVFGDIALGIEVANKDEAVNIINKVKELIQKSTASDTTTKTEIAEVMVKNQPVTKISRISTDPKDPKSEFCLINIGDRLVIASSSLQLMEGIIDRSQNKSLPSLTNKTGFNALISKITAPSLALVYVDSEKQLQMQTTLNSRLSDLPGNGSGTLLELQKTLLNNPYLKSQSVAAIDLNDKGIHLVSYFKPTTPGTINNFRNANQTLASNIPEGALLYTENNDVVAQLTPILEMMAFSINTTVNSALGQNSDIFKEWENSTGLSIKNDIAPLFSGDTAFVVHPSTSPLFPVSVTLLSSLTDATKVKRSMEKITQVIIKQITEAVFSDVPPPDLKKEDINGVSINSFGEMVPTEAIYNYAFMNNDKLLAISSSTSVLKNVLSVINQAAPSLAKSSRYPEFLKKQTAFTNISFVDMKGIMDLVLPFITEMVPEEQKVAFDQDVQPYLRLINNISGYSIVTNDVIKSEGIIQIVE